MADTQNVKIIEDIGGAEGINIRTVVQEATEQSIQARAKGGTSNQMFAVNWLVHAGAVISPWWSTSRDRQLREFWKKSDHLSGTVYTMVSKMTAIPFKIIARDQSVKQYVRQAEAMTEILRWGAEFGEGWVTFYGKFIEELLCLADKTKVHLGGERLGETKNIRDIVKDKDIGPVLSVDVHGNIVERNVNEWHITPLGNRRWWWLSLKQASGHSGKSPGGIYMTEDHPVLTMGGWELARNIKVGTLVATGDPVPSSDQGKVIVGGLLGDLGIGKITKRSVLRFSHSVKQEAWLERKKAAFSGFQWTGQKVYESKDKKSRFIQVNSRASLGLNCWRDSWYPKGKKIVCREDVESYFSPLMMAIWYCDDGSIQHNCTPAGTETNPAANLYTNGFTNSDVDWLVGFLTGKGISCKKYRFRYSNGKTYPIIHITVEGFRNLVELIGPYVPPEMRYKLPEDAPAFNPSTWEIQPATVYYDEVVESKERDYMSGYNVCKTTYHIGVEETGNFIAANTVVHNSQDNGGFAEIIGPGRPDGPLRGAPTTVAHLDSSHCTRTGNPVFPVVYEDTDGKRYKLHYTRVMYASQMTSPIVDMNGVGFCAVSRVINIAQNLTDILTFKGEKMGSRPHRTIIITKGGLDPKDLTQAFAMAASEMDAQGLERYSKIVVTGDASMEDAGAETIDLATLPDGFDEQTSVTLGMATIALGFGVDARELFPALTSGATRADALLQHMKQRGKGPGQIIQITEHVFNQKFLPPHLRLVFDFQDDVQDRQSAEINKIRSDRRTQDLSTGALDIRGAREIMLRDGDLERRQFERLELEDGRLADGSTVLALFYSNDTQINKYLRFSVQDATDVSTNDANKMLKEIREKTVEVNTVLINERNVDIRRKAHLALMALKHLHKLYLIMAGPEGIDEIPFAVFAGAIEEGVEAIDMRVRTENLLEPDDETDTDGQSDSIKPNTDDTLKEVGVLDTGPL